MILRSVTSDPTRSREFAAPDRDGARAPSKYLARRRNGILCDTASRRRGGDRPIVGAPTSAHRRPATRRPHPAAHMKLRQNEHSKVVYFGFTFRAAAIASFRVISPIDSTRLRIVITSQRSL